MRWLAIILLSVILFPAYAETSTLKKEEILSLADIHFDPFTSCQNKVPCPLITALRQAPPGAWPTVLAKYATDNPRYREDSNYSLLKSAFTAASRAAEKNQVKAVLVLGDFLGHDYRRLYKRYSQDLSPAGYRAFVQKTMQFLTNELAKAFPKTDVYAVIGNNDSYWGDYRVDPQRQFFRDAGQWFASLVKNKENKMAIRTQMPAGGYYAVMLDPHTRLLVLNTVLFSVKAKPKQVNLLAQQQLAWLHQELLRARNSKQHVMIAMHIPMGIDVYATLKYRLFRLVEFWDRAYTSQFEAELKEFSPHIVAIFAGHLHTDWFQMLQVDNRNTIPVTGTPSISPFFGNNPGFKIYQYTPVEGKLNNFQTYYYPLNKQADWGVEYSFDKIYQPNCRQCNLMEGMEQLTPTSPLATYYQHFYTVSTASQPIATAWTPYYWCAIQAIDGSKYKKCSNIH